MGVGGGGVASFSVVGSPTMSVIEDSSRVTVESLEEVCEEEAAVAAPITESNRTETKYSKQCSLNFNHTKQFR